MKRRGFVVPVFLPALPGRNRLIDPPVRPAGLDHAAWRERAGAAVDETLARRERRADPGPPQLGFFGGSFGALPMPWQRESLEFAGSLRGRVDSVRVTLEPGDVEAALLDRLAQAKVTTIELDVGSFDDEALATCGFGWRVSAAVEAFGAVHARGFETGLILRPGMPGGTPAEVLRTARRAIELGPAFVRIYPVLVLENTPLATAFESRRYRPLSLDEGVQTCSELLRLFAEAAVPVSRVGFQPAVDLDGGATVIAGPWHPALRALAETPVWLDRASTLIAANFRFQKELTLIVAPQDESRVRGLQGSIVKRLREKFRLEKLHVRIDDAAADGSLALEVLDAGESVVKRVSG